MSEKRWFTADEVLQEQLRDPQFRAEWERTALARALAIWLVRYRTDHKLTQRDLTERLGLSQAVVGRLELAEHTPKMETLLLLADRLGMSLTLEINPPSAGGTEGITTTGGSRLRVVIRPVVAA